MASKKILVADDFDTMRFVLMKGILKLCPDAEIAEASNGKIAMTKIQEAHAAGTPFTHIFCDWNMPESTGLNVLEFCQANEEFKNIYFVMVTGVSETQNVVLALKTGANQFIAKPITPDELIQKLHKIFKL